MEVRRRRRVCAIAGWRAVVRRRHTVFILRRLTVAVAHSTLATSVAPSGMASVRAVQLDTVGAIAPASAKRQVCDGRSIDQRGQSVLPAPVAASVIRLAHPAPTPDERTIFLFAAALVQPSASPIRSR
jgi:hypothetical protein